MRGKRWAHTFLAVILLVISIPLRAEAEEAPARQIALIYDDSGSMIFNMAGEYQENWYRAKYAMEVFAAMMGQQDTMTVFPMSYYYNSEEGSASPITLRGEETAEQRVKALHEMNHEYLGTPFHAVRAACQFLQQADSGAEKWLVVLTDGAFEGVPEEGTEGFLRQRAAQAGFKVIYLAMGSEAVAIDNDPEAGLYSYLAVNSSDILDTVTQVANQVFSRRALPAQQIKSSGDDLTLQLDVPVSELILFVQGEDVEVGSLYNTAGTDSWSASTKTRVKYSDQMPPNYSSETDRAKASFDHSLQGLLADFVPDQPIQSGEYRLTVSHASQVEVYYTPYVEVGVRLTDAMGNHWELKGDTSNLFSGSYTAEAYLVDPFTGEQLESQLVRMENAQIDLENNGVQIRLDNLGQDHVQMSLERGEISGSITAELDGYQTVSSEFHAEILPALWQAELECTLPEEKDGTHYGVEKLNQGEAIRIKVLETDPETGESGPMEQKDWENARPVAATVAARQVGLSFWKKPLYALYDLLYARGEKTLDWTVSPGEEVSTYEVRPTGGESVNRTLWGEVQVQIQMVNEGQNHSSTAQGVYTVSIAPLPLVDILPGVLPALAAGALLVLALILWWRKKRLPRGLVAELQVHAFGIGTFSGGDQAFPVPIRRKFSLFRAETASLNPSVAGVLSVPPLRLSAKVRTARNGKRRFCITNLPDLLKDKSIQPVQLNGVKAGEGDEKRLQKGNCEVRCMANRDHKVGNHDICTLVFRIEKRRKGIFGLRSKKKKRRHSRRHR